MLNRLSVVRVGGLGSAGIEGLDSRGYPECPFGGSRGGPRVYPSGDVGEKPGVALPSELRSALAEQLRGKIAFDQGRGEDAAELLLNAAQRLGSLDPTLARDTHLEALAAAVWASGANGRVWINKTAEAALAAPPAAERPRTSDLILDALACRVTEGYEASAPKLTKALAAARGNIIGADDVENLLWLAGNRAAGIIATEAWDYETGRTLAERQVAMARDSGALIQLQFALNFLANNIVLTGDLTTAAALVEEARALSTMTRVAPVGYSSLLLDAFRGDAARALPVIRSTIETATRDGQGRIVAFAHYVAAVLYNGLGRHADALDCARRVLEWDALGYQTLAAAELAEAASRVWGDAVHGFAPEVVTQISDTGSAADLASEVGGYGITTNAVTPGRTAPPAVGATCRERFSTPPSVAIPLTEGTSPWAATSQNQESK